MKFLAILLLSITFLTVSLEARGQEYFYFGNTNLVGTGARIEGKKMALGRYINEKK
jgi:hypothetical protein